ECRHDDGEERGQEDDDDLRFETDPRDEDDERDQRDIWRRVEGREQRVEEIVDPTEPADREPQRYADRERHQETDRELAQARPDMRQDRPRAEVRERGLPDRAGCAQQRLPEQSGVRRDLPHDGDPDESDDAVVETFVACAEAREPVKRRRAAYRDHEMFGSRSYCPAIRLQISSSYRANSGVRFTLSGRGRGRSISMSA